MSNISKRMKQFSVSIESSKAKRQPNLWVFGEWFGTRANDNPCFLANYIVSHYSNIKVYWISNEDGNTKLLDNNIVIVKKDTDSCRKILLKAGASFVNEANSDFDKNDYNYVNGAVTVNLWHGIPWKHIFNDEIKANRFMTLLHRRIFCMFNNAKYWLAPSNDLTSILVHSNFVNPNSIIKSGYPRNSLFYDKEKVKELSVKVKKSLGINSFSKIVAYMPTFRDKGDEVFNFESLASDPEFSKWLSDNDVYIVQKAHFVNQSKHNLSGVAIDEANKRIINDNSIAAFELMAAADILVTDYSSCFFDYLILDRPIIHFIYDYDKYANEDRGLYYSADEVCCGDAVKTVEDLKHSLAANLENPDKDKGLRRKRRNRFINYENDHSCEDIYQFVKDKVEKKFKTSLD